MYKHFDASDTSFIQCCDIFYIEGMLVVSILKRDGIVCSIHVKPGIMTMFDAWPNLMLKLYEHDANAWHSMRKIGTSV